MSRWALEFDNHPIHETIRQSQEWLKTEVEDANFDFADELRRLAKIVNMIHSVINGIDSEFAPMPWIEQLNQHMQHPHFYQSLQKYSKVPQRAHLETANNHITQFAPQIYNLAALSQPPKATKIIEDAQSAFEAFAKSMELTVNKSKSNAEKVSEETLELEERIIELEQKRIEIANSLTAKITELEAAFNENKLSQDTEHSHSQTAREEEFRELIATWQLKLDSDRENLISKNAEKLDTLRSELSASASETLNDVKSKHKDVLEIHKLVGRDSVAGGYQRSAGEERDEADKWRWISMGSLVCAVLWLAYKYNQGFSALPLGEMNWSELITATSLTAILLISAGYASRQSKMHRDNEKQLRSYALETKALDPFIASLPPEEQQAIKAELVRRMFGQQNNQSLPKNVKLDDSTVSSLFENLTKMILDVSSKIQPK